jgi:hypothetical protein
MRTLLVSAILATAALTTGCGTYYAVRDPATGNSYYTKDVDKAGKAGSVTFKDERTDSVVTIQNSEVKEISGREYKDGVRSR